MEENSKYHPEHEEYRLILTHEYVDDNGDKYSIEDPIIVKQVFLKCAGYVPQSVIINEMLDRMRDYMLKIKG